MAFDGTGLLQAIERARATALASAQTRLAEQGKALLEQAEGAADFPIDTSSLQQSGAVSDPTFDGTTAAVTLSFGGPSTGPNDPVDYAEPVHEGFDLVAWGHPTGRHIPGRPYLQTPMETDGGQALEDAGRSVFADIAETWEHA